MPGFDGTGPRGLGPMTGWGGGYCIVPLSSTLPASVGRRSYPLHSARWGILYTKTGSLTPGQVPVAHRMSRQQERDFLKNRAHAMRDQLEQIEARIQTLERAT